MADIKKKVTSEEKDTAKKTEPTVVAKSSSAKKVQPKEQVSVSHEKVVKVSKKKSALTVELFDLKGAVVSNFDLPAGLFEAKVNNVLMAQAVRVYLANQRRGTVSTKTRGEVAGSTRKIYRQKGTGRARHGGIRAPIFVKGGIAHGPKPKDYELSMPTKMRRAALFSALTLKHTEGATKFVQGLAEVEQKTKAMSLILKDLGVSKKVLVVMPKDLENVYKAARNIPSITITSADRLNTYDVLNAKTLLIMKDAIDSMEKTFLK